MKERVYIIVICNMQSQDRMNIWYFSRPIMYNNLIELGPLGRDTGDSNSCWGSLNQLQGFACENI